MAGRSLRLASLIVVMAVEACSQAQANEDSLRASFAERISSSSFVTDFERDGDQLNFTGPDGQGGNASWRVQIESSRVDPKALDEARPFEGRITAAWYRNGELVEYAGDMTALPKDFLDRGVGQECWAYWIEAERRWDW